MLKGQKIDEQKINLRPHGKVGVRFHHVFDTPGDNPGSVVVGTDGSTPDNTVYFNARTIPKIPVLVINGRAAADPEKDAAYYLNRALAPWRGFAFYRNHAHRGAGIAGRYPGGGGRPARECRGPCRPRWPARSPRG